MRTSDWSFICYLYCWILIASACVRLGAGDNTGKEMKMNDVPCLIRFAMLCLQTLLVLAFYQATSCSHPRRVATACVLARQSPWSPSFLPKEAVHYIIRESASGSRLECPVTHHGIEQVQMSLRSLAILTTSGSEVPNLHHAEVISCRSP